MDNVLKRCLCAALCGAVMMCAGCGKSGGSQPTEISVDGSGEDVSAAFPAESCGVTLAKAPEKAVSLSPAVTEIICELGFKSVLVGISDYCVFPENLTAQKTGSTENPDIDRILSLKPDAVFTLSPLSERETYTLEQAGIVVLNAEPPKDMEGYSALYREIAAAFYGKETTGSEKETTKAVKAGADARSQVEKAAKSVSLGSFAYVTEKLAIAGTDTFESAVFGLCGANVCKEKGYVSPETMGEAAPEYIIADNTLTESDLAADPTLNTFIVGGARVRFVDSERLERPSARLTELFAQLKDSTASDNGE